jgi:hypothetical protein
MEWVNIEELPKLYSDHNIMVAKALRNDESASVSTNPSVSTYCQNFLLSHSCRDVYEAIGGEEVTSATSARKY